MKPRVLIAGFKHETNTFSILPTGLDAYRARCLYHGEDIAPAFENTNSEIAGFMDVAARHGWQTVPSIVGDASPSGRVTTDAFRHFADRIITDATSGGPVDAILLQLHGAMVTEHAFDGEGALLAEIRSALGPTIPIGITLDLHGNVTDDMARHADVIVSYRTYPHVDQHEIAVECAELIGHTLSGEIRPACFVRRPPMLTGLDHGRTTAPGPMRDALAKAAALMEDERIYSVSVMAGFSPADIPDAGPSVVYVGDASLADRHRKIDEIVQFIWETRAVQTVKLASTSDAITTAKAIGVPGKPVVIADFADNPGGGGYGDSTGLLRALVDSGLDHVAYGVLFDPESAAACHAAGVGSEITLKLGGKIDSQFGPPVEAAGTVMAVSDGTFRFEGPMQKGVPTNMGPSAAFRTGGVTVIVGSRRYQNYDRMFFLSLDVDPNAQAVVAVKSAQHFRAAYQPMASEVIVIDDGNGITTEDLSRRTYSALRRPIYPFDLD